MPHIPLRAPPYTACLIYPYTACFTYPSLYTACLAYPSLYTASLTYPIQYASHTPIQHYSYPYTACLTYPYTACLTYPPPSKWWGEGRQLFHGPVHLLKVGREQANFSAEGRELERACRQLFHGHAFLQYVQRNTSHCHSLKTRHGHHAFNPDIIPLILPLHAFFIIDNLYLEQFP